MSPDFTNAAFEFAGAGFAAFDIVKLIHSEGKVAGVYWPGRIFFTVWGFWNVFYYPLIDQPWSLVGATALAVINLIWLLTFFAARYADKWSNE